MSYMAPHQNQLTLRGLDPRVEAEIRRVARSQGISLNKAALRLLERGAGIDAPVEQERQIGSSLDRFIGVWSAREASTFERAIRSVERVDKDFWE
ncbi:MAG: hypothetical protein SFV15_22295 [Polyangiaceae bacterium]|nr:hypothetical protein [Polyangiaceae bacterium]